MGAVATFLLVAGHGLAAAGWFGAMVYSWLVVQPRAREVLGVAGFERFSVQLAHGARWKVIAALGWLGLSGVGLLALESTGRAHAAGWVVVVALKGVIWVAALGVFWYVSWRMWPARVLALPDEATGHQRAFRRVGATLVVLAGLEIALGIALHTVV